MSAIVWLASYPKSGNTWLRVLLINYLRDADAPADINALGEGGQFASAGTRRWFDEQVGVEASALEPAVIDRLRPEVYRRLAREATDELYIKVHDAWRRTDSGEAMFPPDVTKGVVYIVRNPLDTAVSFAHHSRVSVEQAVRWLCDPSHCLGNPLTGLDEQLRQVLGSWSNHARSWLDHSGLPCHVVRYEDLWRDTEGAFGKVLGFCGLPYDPSRVRKAVAFSSFAELERQEREHGFRERSPAADGGFFRRGEVGAWREELPAELAQRLEAAHGATMRRFGYPIEVITAEVGSGSGIAGRA
jgi:hypothetical protein